VTRRPPPALRERVPLAPRTSLGLGGEARWWIEAGSVEEIQAALDWADDRGIPATILGGGSNVIVPDEGIDGLVLHVAPRGVDLLPQERPGGPVRVWAAAGEPWDPLVALTVDGGLAGLECLSGIPGLVGATPIQNVGAYGVEVASLLSSVEVLHRPSGELRVMAPEECGFAYRDSRFRRAPDEHVVLAVTFALTIGGAPVLRYPELARAVGQGAEPSLAHVRETVLALRKRKSMVLGVPDDPNGQSAGSFFTNPIVSAAQAQEVVRDAVQTGLADTADEVPHWPLDDGRVKLAAGWLVQRAGFPPGTRRGPVGVSSRHALALVHHGGGSTRALLALADEVARAVEDRFGVRLAREPVVLGR